MSTLAERLTMVIDASKEKQTVFARKLGVTPNYISMITHGKKEFISPTLALLIQYVYGFSSEWIMNGNGPKMERSKYIANIKNKLEDLSSDSLELVNSYIDTLAKK